MIIIRNNIIPSKGFSAINLFGILFVRKDVKLTATIINHEEIHSKQMRELLYVFFYLWYFIEWIYRLVFEVDAYKTISFEREAYENEKDNCYLIERKRFSFLKYI